MDILFLDNGRQDEIETFYEACQRHRDFYRGYPKAYHPLLYFKEPTYYGQCPPDMTPTLVISGKHLDALMTGPMRTEAEPTDWAIARALSSPLRYPKYPIEAFLRNVYTILRACTDKNYEGLFFNRTYLDYPMFFVKYKQPLVLPTSIGRTSGMPALPSRTLAGRFNKAACKAFVR